MLPTFALFKSDRASTDQDSEAQDPLKTAIKEALKIKEDDLTAIQDFVTTEVCKIAAETVSKIAEMDEQIAATLNPIVTTKKWDSLFLTSITGDEGIPLNKRGSGTKRLVLLNFFRAKAEKDASNAVSGSVIYAVEEPETSQHPDNQRMLITALNSISEQENSQTIVTTHSPMLARTISDQDLRFVQKRPDGTRNVLLGGTDTNTEIAKTLGILPDHSVKAFIGVEGKNDIGFLKNISSILNSAEPDIPDLGALEMSGDIVFFPFGGSNLALWTSRLAPFNRPEFHLYDRDCEPPHEPKYQLFMDEVNARDMCVAHCTGRRELENYIHGCAVVEAYATFDIVLNLPDVFEEFDDVPTLVARQVHELSASTQQWEDLDIAKQKSKTSSVKGVINHRAAANMNCDRLRQIGCMDEVRGWLIAIREIIETA